MGVATAISLYTCIQVCFDLGVHVETVSLMFYARVRYLNLRTSHSNGYWHPNRWRNVNVRRGRHFEAVWKPSGPVFAFSCSRSPSSPQRLCQLFRRLFLSSTQFVCWRKVYLKPNEVYKLSHCLYQRTIKGTHVTGWLARRNFVVFATRDR